MIRRLIIIIIMLLGLKDVQAQIKIMVISDPHVMGPGLLISEGEAWYNAIKFDRKLNEYSQRIFDEAVAIAKRENPDVFLISGDLTKDGELLSHQYVVKKLTELKDAGIRTLVIPGNHDMGTLDAYYFDDTEIYDAEVVDTSQFATMYKDFGYGEDMQRESSTLTWCCEPVNGLVIIGIDTGHDNDPLNGVISDTTLEWVCGRAREATDAGKKVIVMMHHSLFPHVTNAERFSSTYAVKLGIKNYEGTYFYHSYSYVRNSLANAGVAVVLSGHVHASDIAKDANGDLTRTIHDICTATCAAYPNPYRMLTINDDATLSIRTHYISELPGVDNFAAISEERMKEGLMNLVYDRTHNNEVSELFADIFKIHVVGNEPENPRRQEFLDMYDEYLPQMKEDKQINDFLEAYEVTFDDLSHMVSSMLEDKSNYGNPERESLDDDLNTTIPIFGEGWTGMVSKGIWRQEDKEKGDGNLWYTLQGLRIKEPQKKGIFIHNGRLVVNN